MSNKSSDKSEVKKGLSGKTKMYLLVLVAGAGLIAAGLYRNSNKNSDSVAQNNPGSDEVKTEDTKQEAPKNFFEGVLNISDNVALGNLKLLSGEHEIYLRTTRDFSKLIGSQVMVLINGTLDKFELKDIQAKVADDSYILPK